jgi:hypothetical protein
MYFDRIGDGLAFAEAIFGAVDDVFDKLSALGSLKKAALKKGGKAAKEGMERAARGGGGAAKPVTRRYEHNPKHREQAYTDAKGQVVSRKPRGDCQGMLDCSVQKKPTSPERSGVEPSTGLEVIFRRHLVQEFANEIVEFFHGFVPE